MLDDSVAVEVVAVGRGHRLQGLDDLVDAHAGTELERRRRLADVQRADLLDVDENVAGQHFTNTGCD